FTVAGAALLAIAATIGTMQLIQLRIDKGVEEGRRVTNLARAAYVYSGERQLSLIQPKVDQGGMLLGTPDKEVARLAATLDSLSLFSSSSVTRRNHITGIRFAYQSWENGLARVRPPTRRGSTAAANRDRMRFEVLRNRLALLVLAEDALAAERIAYAQGARVVTSIVILAEIIILLMIVSGLRSRLLSQATEVLEQRDILEEQANALEVTNRQLAAAIEAKESARALAEESVAEQTALFTAITEVFFVLDRNGRYHKVAPANNELLAEPRESLLGRRVHEVLPGPIAALALSSISKALDTGQRVDVEYPLDLNGRTIWFAGTVTPLRDDKVLWVVRDVSDGRKAEQALKESEARFRNLVEHSPQAIALHAEGKFLYGNPACGFLLGVDTSAKLMGERVLGFITPDTSPRLLDCLAAVGNTPTRALTCECQFQRRSDSTLRTVEVTSVAVKYDGRAGVLSILHDVTERKQLEEQLAHQAFHDPLTNLANRVLFRDRVEHALQRAAGGSSSPAVLFIDLDNFKAVNDGLGHSAGDWLLIEVAARLAGCLRPGDTVARLGGDEFAVLLEDDAGNSKAVSETILDAFNEPFSVHGTDIVVTMSIGIAGGLAHEGADEVLRNADLALYRAKGAGKARAASFEPEMHIAARRRLELEAELRRAIEGGGEDGHLVLHYQPISKLSTGKMFGFEALVRWEHPARGILEPLDFISLAEETGLIIPLGRWVLGEACRQAHEWQGVYGSLAATSGVSLSVGVNLSGRQLAQPELVQDVADALARSGLPPRDLVLELTESMLVHDNRATLERLRALKTVGVRLSIDDFGTGYSSLAYLERFPVDSLKMDRSFIAGLTNRGAKSPLAEAVVGLGRILGLRVVAEGVETAEQWKRLRGLGCTLAQGFFIARPLPAPEFEKFLATSLEGTKRGVRAGPHSRRTEADLVDDATGLATIN
ncbi:MAG TPA: EAL domain-containing protein, partial [Gemmatimonadaceae bacterium]|nr:EAL domain-containing protein [Gemmatimonadaceae bacterium]